MTIANWIDHRVMTEIYVVNHGDGYGHNETIAAFSAYAKAQAFIDSKEPDGRKYYEIECLEVDP